MRFSQISKLITFSLLLAMFAGLAFAQTSSGTIAGVVTDQTDAVVVGATVAAKSAQTGLTVTATTSGSGAYRLEGLLPGTYTVTISAKGFVTTKVPDLDVRASIITSLNPSLKLGASETVSVEAQTVALSTETGEISASISAREIQGLPISSLNPYQLALTLPGVSSVEGADMTNGTSFSVNGARPRANNFLIEGQDNNDAGLMGQGLQPGNVEAISEVAIFTNAYSAEYGHGGGSVSNLIYKTGTNDFHGSAWNRHFNSSLDAIDKQLKMQPFFDPANDVEKYRQNVYGFAIGGPIKKDKLFFFASYQWDKWRTTTITDDLVLPTEASVAYLRTLPSNPRIDNYLQAIGNLRAPSGDRTVVLGIDPVTLLPRQNLEFGDVKRTGIANLNNSEEFVATGDYIFSKKDTLHLRYVRTYFETPYDLYNFPAQLEGFDTMQKGPAHNAGISETHTFSPSLVNEFRISYGRIGSSFALRPETAANPLAMGPGIFINGVDGYAVSSAMPQGRFHDTYQLQDSISISTGNHFIKVGVDISDVRVRDEVPFNSRGTISYGAGGGTGFANYIDDYSGSTGTTVQRVFGNNISHAGLGTQNYFIHDTWKALPNLTLNFGVRYEYWGAPSNQLAYPAFDINDMDCFPCRVEQQPDKNNWAPRIGVSYTPRFWEGLFGNGKTVISGGFGIFYDGLFTNVVNNTLASTPNAVSKQVNAPVDRTGQSRGIANWSQVFQSLDSTPSPYGTVNSVINNLRNPRTTQWNAKVERELPSHLLASLGYVGTRGSGLYGNSQINPGIGTDEYGTLVRRNSNRGSIVLRDNSGSSSYHALNAQLDRSFGALALRTSYTWSKMMDDVSEVFTDGNWSSYPVVQYPSSRKDTDWGRSPFDHKHRLAISYVFEPPKWNTTEEGFQAFKHIVNGWQFSGTTSFQSGTPTNVFIGYDVNGDGVTNDRPNLGNPSAPMHTYAFDGSYYGMPGSLCDGWYVWNTNDDCHVVSANSVHWIVPFGEPGNVPRNYLTSPGVQNWDFSIQRRFSLTERQKLEFRAEMINALNQGRPDLSLLGLTLVDDIPEPGSNDKIYFNNYYETTSGHRRVRFYLKYSF